jgi:hypothetical protein
MPEVRASRRAGRGKSASPVRRGESGSRRLSRPLSYSTGSALGASLLFPYLSRVADSTVRKVWDGGRARRNLKLAPRRQQIL